MPTIDCVEPPRADAGLADGGAVDGGMSDASGGGIDASARDGGADAGPSTVVDGGCGCVAVGTGSSRGVFIALALLGVVIARRRTR